VIVNICYFFWQSLQTFNYGQSNIYLFVVETWSGIPIYPISQWLIYFTDKGIIPFAVGTVDEVLYIWCSFHCLIWCEAFSLIRFIWWLYQLALASMAGMDSEQTIDLNQASSKFKVTYLVPCELLSTQIHPLVRVTLIHKSHTILYYCRLKYYPFALISTNYFSVVMLKLEGDTDRINHCSYISLLR